MIEYNQASVRPAAHESIDPVARLNFAARCMSIGIQDWRKSKARRCPADVVIVLNRSFSSPANSVTGPNTPIEGQVILSGDTGMKIRS